MDTNWTCKAIASVMLVTGMTHAQMHDAVSDVAALDTRSLSTVAAAEDQGLDTRGFTTGWSAARKLNTKKIRGTMMLLR
jgi:hypothetical protein